MRARSIDLRPRFLCASSYYANVANGTAFPADPTPNGLFAADGDDPTRANICAAMINRGLKSRFTI
jgi:hypothetical protein